MRQYNKLDLKKYNRLIIKNILVLDLHLTEDYDNQTMFGTLWQQMTETDCLRCLGCTVSEVTNTK